MGPIFSKKIPKHGSIVKSETKFYGVHIANTQKFPKMDVYFKKNP